MQEPEPWLYNPKIVGFVREFPKIRGTLFWGPYYKDPTLQGTILGYPIFGNSYKRSPNKGPRFLNQVPALPSSQET